MAGPLDSVTGALIGKALDVSLVAHQSIANNIANSETSGYRPVKVNFDDVMQEVKSAIASGASDEAVKAALSRVNPSPEEEPLSATVLLDQQMVQLVQNTVHYEALLAARGGLGDILKLAIKGGRG